MNVLNHILEKMKTAGSKTDRRLRFKIPIKKTAALQDAAQMWPNGFHPRPAAAVEKRKRGGA